VRFQIKWHLHLLTTNNFFYLDLNLDEEIRIYLFVIL